MRRLLVLALSIVGLLVMAAPVSAAGAIQISGVGTLVAIGEVGVEACPEDLFPGEDNDVDQYALELTGDLEGCIYGLVTSARFHPSGMYQEVADEIFVGSWDGGLPGTFELTEFFTAKFDTETEAQIFGRCQHPITTGSGTGAFEGVSGRLDFKDDVNLGVAYYRGHLKLGS